MCELALFCVGVQVSESAKNRLSTILSEKPAGEKSNVWNILDGVKDVVKLR